MTEDDLTFQNLYGELSSMFANGPLPFKDVYKMRYVRKFPNYSTEKRRRVSDLLSNNEEPQ